ncbi:MAG: DUF3795 domain-containing protein [Patescibacteria group bacterium]|nr:DUF3795 domain-containing protein [Patescibacteria group bacterium]
MEFNKDLIAPCGMNCGVCKRYLATKKGINKEQKIPECLGCRFQERKCSFLKGKCEFLKKEKIKFCYECPDFPCQNLETLDKRYRTRYNTSLIGNLKEIKGRGLKRFLAAEAKKWQRPDCEGTISIHDGKCY